MGGNTEKLVFPSTASDLGKGVALLGVKFRVYTYMHTYIHTYVHTYIHTYVHTYVCTSDILYRDIT